MFINMEDFNENESENLNTSSKTSTLRFSNDENDLPFNNSFDNKDTFNLLNNLNIKTEMLSFDKMPNKEEFLNSIKNNITSEDIEPIITKEVINFDEASKNTIKFEFEDAENIIKETKELTSEFNQTVKFEDIEDELLTQELTSEFNPTVKFEDLKDELITKELTSELKSTIKFENLEDQEIKTKELTLDKNYSNINLFNLDDIYDNENQDEDILNYKIVEEETTNGTEKVNFTKKLVNSLTQILFNDEPELNKGSQYLKEKNINEIDYVGDRKISKEQKKLFKEEKINKNKKIKIDFKLDYNKLPKFYKSEFLNSKIKYYLSIIISLISCGTLIATIYNVVNQINSPWLFLPQAIFMIFCFIFTMTSHLKYSSFKKEVKINNYNIQNENPTTTITRTYKSLCTSNINLNWFSATTYLVSGLIILLTFIVTYFHNLINLGINDFNLLIVNGNDTSPIIVVGMFGALVFSTLFIQIFYNIYNNYRKNSIELFYNKELIEPELVKKYKSSANKRGLICFLTTTIVLSFVVVLTYFILKKRTAKTLKIN